MLFFGVMFGALGVWAAHLLTKHLSNYYLILIPAIVAGILLGLGLNLGARIGRCSRFSIITFIFALLAAVVMYGSLLFFNHYHDTSAPQASIAEEVLFLFADSWNFLAELPYVSDYMKPVTDQQVRDTLTGVPGLSALIPPADQPLDSDGQPPQDSTANADATNAATDQTAAPQAASAREHIGRQIMAFAAALPQKAMAEEPVLIGSIFNLVIFAPVQQSLEIPGVTQWDGKPEDGRLLFDARAVQPWMVWSVEAVFAWLIAALMTRSGTNAAYDRHQSRIEQSGGRPRQGLQIKPPSAAKQESVAGAAEEKSAKEKKAGFSWFKRKKKATIPLEETASPEIEATLTPADTSKKEKGGLFGWLKKKSAAKTEEAPEMPAAAGKDDVNFELPEEGGEPTQDQRFALILHQYEPTRQEDLVQLIQQIGQVPEDRARKLLKTPSLIKRDVTVQQANIAIQKFNQVHAQVKLMPMEQLLQLQTKQQPAQPAPPETPKSPQPAQLATKKPAPAAPKPPAAAPIPQGAPGERYALILRKFDPAQRKQVLELLGSLSGTPPTQLQQTLKTPALVLRDSSKDEVTMISQQFQKIQADVKVLTMTELQKLMNKNG